MDRAFITITHRSVEHTDPDAAGFVDGYWFTVSDHFGLVESACATADKARAFAVDVAHRHGYADDQIAVVEDLKLLGRGADEARVERMIASADDPI